MRKLLYIPCNQDGFLPSCSSLPFLSGLQPADIFSYFAAKTFTALILYHKPATKASRIFAKSISAICGVTSHRQFTCGKRRTHIFYPCLTDPISFRKAFPIIFHCTAYHVHRLHSLLLSDTKSAGCFQRQGKRDPIYPLR